MEGAVWRPGDAVLLWWEVRSFLRYVSNFPFPGVLKHLEHNWIGVDWGAQCDRLSCIKSKNKESDSNDHYSYYYNNLFFNVEDHVDHGVT